MSGLVVKITKNYFDRRKGLDVEPMLSAYPEMNEAFKKELEGATEEEKVTLG
jgi:AGCS family alanine or glycine:cation symporter